MTSSLSAQTSNDCYIRVKGLMYVFCVRSWNITLGTGELGFDGGIQGSGIWDLGSIDQPPLDISGCEQEQSGIPIESHFPTHVVQLN